MDSGNAGAKGDAMTQASDLLNLDVDDMPEITAAICDNAEPVTPAELAWMLHIGECLNTAAFRREQSQG
jgi:hypothetical protein